MEGTVVPVHGLPLFTGHLTRRRPFRYAGPEEIDGVPGVPLRRARVGLSSGSHRSAYRCAWSRPPTATGSSPASAPRHRARPASARRGKHSLAPSPARTRPPRPERLPPRLHPGSRHRGGRLRIAELDALLSKPRLVAAAGYAERRTPEEVPRLEPRRHDGTTHVAAWVNRTEPAAAQLPAPLLDAGGARPRERSQPGAAGALPASCPPPAQLPTAGSLLARWQASRAEPAQGYGFSFNCDATCSPPSCGLWSPPPTSRPQVLSPRCPARGDGGPQRHHEPARRGTPPATRRATSRSTRRTRRRTSAPSRPPGSEPSQPQPVSVWAATFSPTPQVWPAAPSRRAPPDSSSGCGRPSRAASRPLHAPSGDGCLGTRNGACCGTGGRRSRASTSRACLRGSGLATAPSCTTCGNCATAESSRRGPTGAHPLFLADRPPPRRSPPRGRAPHPRLRARRAGLRLHDVAERTGLKPSTVSYHVQRLQQAGLLHATRGPSGFFSGRMRAVSAAQDSKPLGRDSTTFQERTQ